MRAPQSVIIQRDQVTAVAIEQRYYLVRQSDKVAALTRILEHEDSKRGLIFARTRVGTAELATALTLHGFGADTLDGDLTQEARERVLNRFRNNQIQVLVATDVAARGLDIDDISHVFNYDLPSEVEVYVHRIGRTSKTGIAISLITPALVATFFLASVVEACSTEPRRQGLTRNGDGSPDIGRRQDPWHRPERSGRHHRLSRRYPRQCHRQDPHRKPKILRRSGVLVPQVMKQSGKFKIRKQVVNVTLG